MPESLIQSLLFQSFFVGAMSDFDLKPVVKAVNFEVQGLKKKQEKELNTFKAYLTAQNLEHLIPLIEKSEPVKMDLLLLAMGNTWRIQQLKAQYEANQLRQQAEDALKGRSKDQLEILKQLAHHVPNGDPIRRKDIVTSQDEDSKSDSIRGLEKVGLVDRLDKYNNKLYESGNNKQSTYISLTLLGQIAVKLPTFTEFQ